MVAKFKPVLPKALPKKVFDLALKNAAKDMEQNIKGDFEHETSWWKTPPTFDSKMSVRSGEAKVTVYTENEVFKFLDEGTKAHFIRPVRAKVLHWVAPDGENAFSKGHMVSGIKPRKITEKVEKKNVKLMKEVFRYYLNEAVAVSGHMVKR